jgi:PHP family Zn ribbon phosphoesterase
MKAKKVFLEWLKEAKRKKMVQWFRSTSGNLNLNRIVQCGKIVGLKIIMNREYNKENTLEYMRKILRHLKGKKTSTMNIVFISKKQEDLYER